MLRQFDVVQLIDEKHVTYVSGPRGMSASPKGNWSVVGFVDIDVILAKESTIIRVPLQYVRKIAAYDVQNVLDMIDKARPKV